MMSRVRPGSTFTPGPIVEDSVIERRYVPFAADGFARIAGRPAMTVLHLGPGLANGLANLHNAMRARSPVLNVVEKAGFSLAGFPKASAYLDACRARPV